MATDGCPICFDKFQAEGNKCPRLLECGHSFCHGCLCKMPVMKPGELLCPIDRTVTILPNDNVENLKKNYSLIDHLQKDGFDDDETDYYNMPSSSSNSQQQNVQKQNGLSDEAAVGIAAAVGGGLLAVGGLVGFLIGNKTKKTRNKK